MIYTEEDGIYKYFLNWKEVEGRAYFKYYKRLLKGVKL